MWRLPLALVALSALLAAGWYVDGLRDDNAALRASLAAERRALAARDRTIEQRKEAAAVHAAHLKRKEAKSAEYDRLRDTLNGVEDAPLPDWFVDYLRALGLLAPGPR
jgi:hypothetical protein